MHVHRGTGRDEAFDVSEVSHDVITAADVALVSRSGSAAQVAFLVRSVWHAVSALQRGVGDSAHDKGQHRRTAGLRLTRFDPQALCAPGNLVLLREEEAEELRQLGLPRWREAHPEAAAFVAATLARVQQLF